MLKLLYGTSNEAKIKYMKDALKELDIKIIGLKEAGLKVCSIEETGNTPLENSRIKAKAYYKLYKRPVFSCDSGLYIDGIEEEKQPGVYVRRVNGKELTDEQMIDYYSSIAKEMGGQVKAKYKIGICLILNSQNIFEYDGDDISSEKFIITSKPHKKRNKGFPLDSITIDIKTGKYYMDLPPYNDKKEYENNLNNDYNLKGISNNLNYTKHIDNNSNLVNDAINKYKRNSMGDMILEDSVDYRSAINTRYNKNYINNPNRQENQDKIKKGYAKFFKKVLSYKYHY